MQGYEVVIKTGKILDFEMACNALKEADISFIKQEESYTGVKKGYIQPVAGPGTFFNLLVPADQKEKAQRIILELPIEKTTTPVFWHYGATEQSKKVWKVLSLLVLGIAVALFFFNIFNIK